MKHRARKRFGQHFLASPGVIRKIVAAIDPHPEDTVVEIGPGLGALTEPLLARLSHLHVVEIDRDLAGLLRMRYAQDRLTVHEADALAFDFGQIAPGARMKIVGNLPYNISTPLLFHLAQYADRIEMMCLMLQKEVVERMVAQPGGSDYGRLSVMLQYRFALEKLFVVPPGAFVPPPRVESAVVRLTPKSFAENGAQGRVKDFSVFSQLVSAAFAQRRKMVRNALAAWGDEVWLVRCGVDPQARAEDLSVADYIRLADALVERSPA
ncbi:MAG: 16S rRNA (adenine(1518)-N(6)/adenine(1519)-N(6))-dimethyltransferase RsmA [Rhodocyclaceae bacterium]|nr:16S rRNA (adenine(1518)-N(6)/adenine(1519)-N(6))-dimethyltransferase RsmA [Rhodocyclaceae bacterium]